VPDRIISRGVDGRIIEIHTVPVGTNPFAYGSKMAERDTRIGKRVVTYEVVSSHGDIFIACTTPDRWLDLMKRHAEGP
jgi:hypothetical protein